MKSQLIAIGIILLSLFTVKANAEVNFQVIDSICCQPDSLKVVSTAFPQVAGFRQWKIR